MAIAAVLLFWIVAAATVAAWWCVFRLVKRRRDRRRAAAEVHAYIANQIREQSRAPGETTRPPARVAEDADRELLLLDARARYGAELSERTMRERTAAAVAREWAAAHQANRTKH